MVASKVLRTENDMTADGHPSAELNLRSTQSASPEPLKISVMKIFMTVSFRFSGETKNIPGGEFVFSC